MQKLILILIIGFMLTVAKAQKVYFAKYQSMADSLETIYQIPSSVMLAIGFYESAGGKSKVALLLNNHFGIVGANKLMETHKIYSRYRQFESVKASYEGFCRLVASKKFYAKLKGSSDAEAWVWALFRIGYATSGQWPVKIYKLIKQYEVK